MLYIIEDAFIYENSFIYCFLLQFDVDDNNLVLFILFLGVS